MILTVLDAIGWPLGVLFAAVAAWCLFRIVYTPKHPNTGKRVWNIAHTGYWTVFLMFAVAAVSDFTALGVISVITGTVLAVLLLAAFLALGRPWQDRAASRLKGSAATAIGGSARDARSVGARLWAWILSLFGREDEEAPGAAVEEAVAARPVPSVRDDANLGAVPSAAEMAQAPVPEPHAALAAHIAEYRPENAAELTGFFRAHAAGYLAQAHALRTLADGILNEVGLDPAFAHGIAEAGDEVSEMAHVLALVEQRFHVIYGEIMRAVDGGLILPHRAREFFSEGEAA